MGKIRLTNITDNRHFNQKSQKLPPTDNPLIAVALANESHTCRNGVTDFAGGDYDASSFCTSSSDCIWSDYSWIRHKYHICCLQVTTTTFHF